MPELVDTAGLDEADRIVSALFHDNDGEKDHYWSDFHAFTFALCLLQPSCVLNQFDGEFDTAEAVFTKLLADTARDLIGHVLRHPYLELVAMGLRPVDAMIADSRTEP